MANLMLGKLTNFRISAGVFVSITLGAAIYAQATPHLQVELGPNQQITILGSDASYGEILRAMQKKLGWEIEIPALADELKLPHVHIETTQPANALAELLGGSRLGYGMVLGSNKSQTVKVFVVPLSPREAKVTNDTASASAIPDNSVAQTPLPVPGQTVPAIEPVVPEVGADGKQVGGLATLPLSEAINAMGILAGTSPADVGKVMVLPIAEAGGVMGVPPGVSSADVGKSTTLPLPTGPGKHP